jgi:hypothetical protein
MELSEASAYNGGWTASAKRSHHISVGTISTGRQARQTPIPIMGTVGLAYPQQAGSFFIWRGTENPLTVAREAGDKLKSIANSPENHPKQNAVLQLRFFN